MNMWDVAQVALWVVVLANLALTVALIRRVGVLGRNQAAPQPMQSGLPVGTAAPPLPGRLRDGSTVDRPVDGPEPVVLGFFSSTCPACAAQLPQFVEFGRTSAVSTLTVIDAEPDGAAELTGLVPDDQRVLFLGDQDSAAAVLREHGIMALPSYVALGADGRIEGSFGAVDELEQWEREHAPAAVTRR